MWDPGQPVPLGAPLRPVAAGRMEEAIPAEASRAHVQFRFIAV